MRCYFETKLLVQRDLDALFEREWKSLAGTGGGAAACRWREGRAGWSLTDAQELAARLGPAGLGRYAEVPRAAFPGRLDEWVESRRALLEARERAGGGASLLTSLAHSRTGDGAPHALAIAWEGAPPEVLGVGVDLEPADRPVAERLAERILSPGEERVLGGMGALEAWVVKEAAFKAHPRNALKVVPQVVVRSCEKEAGVAFLADLPEPLRFRLARAPGWLAAFAFCERV